MTQDYIDATWRPILERNGMTGFDNWWDLKATWFEEPNRSRSGWSGVSRIALPRADGREAGMFLKRQENHNTFSWRHPLQGIPTFAREFRHILHYRRCGVPTLEPVYFASRNIAGTSRAILATAELDGFMSLDAWLAAVPRPRAQRLACLERSADVLRHMHRHGIQHSCFFPKHLFVRIAQDGQAEVRVIDLEKSRWRPLAVFCALRDLDSLNRHAPGWSRTDRLRFLLRYLGAAHLTSYAKWLWRRLVARRAKKFGKG